MAKLLKISLNILSFLPLVLVVFFALFAFSSSYPLFGSYRFFTVASGSMEPALKQGSLVLDKKSDSYNKGDAITFLSPGAKDSTTHRIIEIVQTNKGTMYKVKGDANNAPDKDLVSIKYVVGKVIFSLPFIGYPIMFSKTLPGLVILIVIPATIIVYSELLNIKNETLRLIHERKRRKLSLKEKIEKGIGEEMVSVEKEIKSDIDKVVKK